MAEEKTTNSETPNASEAGKPEKKSASIASTMDKDDPSSLDFSGVATLANKDWKREPWYKSFGNAILEALISGALFIGSFLLDIIKTLWLIIKGLFVGIYYIGRGIVLFFRKLARMFREGDSGVRLSFVISGAGNFKVGQIVDGCLFLGVEILFIVFMVLIGANNIYNLIFLGETARGIELEQGTSIRSLISGILTVIAIVAYIYVWYTGVRSAYDGYVIKNNYRFLAAKQDALYVFREKERFTDIYQLEEGTNEDGTPKRHYHFVSKGKIKNLMRKKYGYSRLSSLYISYVPFNNVNYRKFMPITNAKNKVVNGVYLWYKGICEKVKAGKWANACAKYVNWQPLKKKPTRGTEAVENLLTSAINQHRHTFDKYNVYIAHVRDAKADLSVLADPELLEKAMYAEDPVDVRNGVPAIPHTEKVKAKVAASRIIGAFGCSYDAALNAANVYLRAKKESEKTGKGVLDIVREIAQGKQDKLDLYIDANYTKRNACIAGMRKAYKDYDNLRGELDAGSNVFLSTVKNQYGIFDKDAKNLLQDYRYAIAQSGDDVEETKRLLAQYGEHYETEAKIYDGFPFCGVPIHFGKKAKQYLDEKFAVTVLAFPVLGAMIFSVLPLFFSIIIAFTNYNYTTGYNHVGLGLFDWDWLGFKSLFGIGGSSGLVSTFMYILGWTIIWAFFATFMNYILGIVLALLINNKHIKLKKLWRTFFVISIAIPQFITLLAMSKILGAGGPINTWFYNNGWCSSLNTFWLNDTTNDALIPKIMLIVVNCWIGIPFTMLSTTGILMNIPEDLYESARIDGASAWKQFWKITMPYILFVTGPSLLTTFIGNINNFNVIYFLTGGGPESTAMNSVQLQESAQLTDLLITWLYKMTVNNVHPKYATGSVLGILIFAICAFFSLIVYKRMGSTQNEEAFQ